MNVNVTSSDLKPFGGCINSEQANNRIGIIDIGSNTLRMVVYEAPARLPIPIFNEREICALGKGIGKTQLLNPTGKVLAFEALDRFCSLAKEMKVGQFRILATAAVRDAKDGIDFAKKIEDRYGCKVKILSGSEEAQLGAQGILGGRPDADGLFGDIGGGSLDLVSLNSGEFGFSCTLPLGHLRLAEDSEGKIKKAQEIVDRKLAMVNWLSEIKGRDFFAVGGSWRVIARIYMQQNNYPLHLIDNLTVDVEVAEDITEVISQLSSKSLRGMAAIAKRRIDTLPFSALLLNRILKLGRPKQLIFSGYGLREGQFFELLPLELKRLDPLISACLAFAERNGRFSIHGEEIASWILPLFPDATERDKRILKAAAILSDIGWTEHPDYRALHSFTRILRLPVAVISHRDRVIIALAVFFRYNGLESQQEVKEVQSLIRESDLQLAIIFGSALRLAHVLSAGIPDLLCRTNIKLNKKDLELDIRNDTKLFGSQSVKKLVKRLANLMEVNFSIKTLSN